MHGAVCWVLLAGALTLLAGLHAGGAACWRGNICWGGVVILAGGRLLAGNDMLARGRGLGGGIIGFAVTTGYKFNSGIVPYCMLAGLYAICWRGYM
jgi:hypothetical protein